MRANAKLDADVLVITLEGIEDSSRARGTVCSIELAILRKTGHHNSSPWTWVDGKTGRYATAVWKRERSDSKTLGDVRAILKGFCL